MKKIVFLICFALLMSISFSSYAAYFVSVGSVNGSGTDYDSSTFNLPANTWASYSLIGSAVVTPSGYNAAYFNASLTSDIGNDYIADYADATTEDKYEAYGYSSGQLYCFHHSHSITIEATAWSSGVWTHAEATVSVDW